jgi:hypothetical protein
VRYRNTQKLKDSLDRDLRVNTRGSAPLYKDTDNIETALETSNLRGLGTTMSLLLGASFSLSFQSTSFFPFDLYASS